MQLSTVFLLQAGTIVATASATFATMRTRLGHLGRRVSDLERELREMPSKYVPRTEVELGMRSLDSIAKQTQNLILAAMYGDEHQRLRKIEASAALDRYIDLPSEAKLSVLHPTLSAKVHAALDDLAAQGIYCRVAQGLRNYEEQDALFFSCHHPDGTLDHTKPWKTNARGGYSNHNFGLAVDCYPFLEGSSGPLEMENPASPKFVAMVKALKAQGLAWGGDWIHEKDAPHFQLAGVPVTPTEADRVAFKEGSYPKVWAQYHLETA